MEESVEESEQRLPVVPLRGMNVLPGMLTHIDIDRKITVAAIEEAMAGGQQVFAVAQRDGRVESPEREDLYEAGSISLVKQLMRLPNASLRVMLEGVERGVMTDLWPAKGGFLEAAVERREKEPDLSVIEEEAMIRQLRELMDLYANEGGRVSESTLRRIGEMRSVARVIDEIAANIAIPLEGRQSILEEMDLVLRFERMAALLAREVEILGIRHEYQVKVKAQVDQDQKEYFLREQMRVISEELGEGVSLIDKLAEKIDRLEASDEVKEKLAEELEHLRAATPNSSEGGVIRSYIETLLELPWEKESEDDNDIAHAEQILEEDHYGLKKVKERVLEFLAVRCLTGECDAPILCLVGPPGTGKTSIARSVARALGKKYVRICLGGVRDEAEIRGHRKTYIGAMPGRIAEGLRKAGVKNPLMLLDEIDKVSSDYRGDVSSALLEVLDGEQNSRFTDHYVEIPLDLSKVLFIATANSTQEIPRPLLDRMEVIEVSSYTENEKFHIAKEHLLPKTKKKNGLLARQLSVSDKALEKIIRGYTREAGVRSLERRLGEICRKAAKEILEAGPEAAKKKAVRVTPRNLEKYLGKETYAPNEANKVPQVGIVRGLAWTSVGGVTLEIEVNVMRGKGELSLTGKLGDVMKESAMAGISYVRSIADRHQIPEDFFETHDIHIHIPEGAVPKDGPSAGITMATAMLSAITGKKVRADVAMTGEITLRGRVLPIGGLKEKILAAKAAKIQEVLVPKENRKDIEEMEPEVLEGISVTYVESMDQVWGKAAAE